MEATKEQIASDIVRNLSISLAELVKAYIDAYSVEGRNLRKDIEKKLQKWIEKL